MKIYCDKCGGDITAIINHNFEENKIGNYTCLKCNSKQKRYISETDLLIYLSFQETLYFVLSFITSIILNTYEVSLFAIVPLIIILVLATILTSRFKAFVYLKAPLKKATMYKSRIENQDKIAKSIRWQYLLFFALVITFFTQLIGYWLFVFASIIAISATIIKAILSAKNE